jgi:hypothetical protein
MVDLAQLEEDLDKTTASTDLAHFEASLDPSIDDPFASGEPERERKAVAVDTVSGEMLMKSIERDLINAGAEESGETMENESERTVLKVGGGTLSITKDDDGQDVVEMRVSIDSEDEDGWTFSLSREEKAVTSATGGKKYPEQGKYRSRIVEKAETPSGEDVGKKVVVPILHKREAQQIVTGVVLVPDKVDAQGDVISAEAIAKASFDFAQRYGTETKIGYMHRDFEKDLRMIESYIAPSEMNLDGYTVPVGSWIMSVKVIDKDVWGRVQRNEIRGFSIGGVAQSVREIEGTE